MEDYVYTPGGALDSQTPGAGPGSAPSDIDTRPNSRLTAIAVSLLVTVLAALVYAAIVTFSNKEFFILAIGLGWAAGSGFTWFTRRSALNGVLAALIGAAGFTLAIVMSQAGLSSRQYGGGVVDEFMDLMGGPLWVMKVYLQDGILSYVFLIVALAMAFAMGATGNEPTDTEDTNTADTNTATPEAAVAPVNGSAYPPPQGPPAYGTPPPQVSGVTPDPPQRW